MKSAKIAALATVALGLVACGSEGDSTFSDGNGDGTIHNDGSNGNALPEIGPTGTASACVSEVQGAELAPTNLIFMYDKSGSMGQTPTFDPALKWKPVSDGMKAFFSDPYSKTLNASLQFFPDGDLPDPPGPADAQRDVNEVCSFDYATPNVSLLSAADASFVSAIDSTAPEGGTPTVPALAGAISYAQKIAAERPTEKTVIVFVTDGEPGFNINGSFVPGCENMQNTIEQAASIAKTNYESNKIPTYVIGVGPSLDKLNAIASAGGTTSALMVDIGDPAATSGKIVETLNQIRKREATCDFAVPPPPAGETLDPYAVNVVLKRADGTESVLGYSKDCSDGAGWQYDSVTNPQRILLCGSSCGEAKASSEGRISIAFGCKTKVSVR